MNSFVKARTLSEYPRGAHRWSLLMGEWVQVALGGMIIYIVAMAFTRGHAAVEEHTAHAPATGKATAS